MLKRSALDRQHKTNSLIWLLAFICAFIATLIIVAGIIVFVGYLAIRPKVPRLYVHSARLDNFIYSQAGVLAVRLTLIVKAENHNMKAHVSFYDTRLILGYHGLSIAELVADPFEVKKNSTMELSYVVESSPIPLEKEEQYLTEQSLARNKMMPFFVKGTSRVRWRVGPLGSVKFWVHIKCYLYLPINASVVYPHCSTKSH
uniref:NDR1/HIN1-like protein 12 n=1 Tax=Erigeron canadensis TaxID=72917 RepID=UPI001CB954BC|nr:NDR1/HIN1-like protein 12 [Erigeron canadensis]